MSSMVQCVHIKRVGVQLYIATRGSPFYFIFFFFTHQGLNFVQRFTNERFVNEYWIFEMCCMFFFYNNVMPF